MPCLADEDCPKPFPNENMKPVAAARLFDPATLEVSQAHMTEMGTNLHKSGLDSGIIAWSAHGLT